MSQKVTFPKLLLFDGQTCQPTRDVNFPLFLRVQVLVADFALLVEPVDRHRAPSRLGLSLKDDGRLGRVLLAQDLGPENNGELS